MKKKIPRKKSTDGSKKKRATSEKKVKFKLDDSGEDTEFQDHDESGDADGPKKKKMTFNLDDEEKGSRKKKVSFKLDDKDDDTGKKSPKKKKKIKKKAIEEPTGKKKKKKPVSGRKGTRREKEDEKEEDDEEDESEEEEEIKAEKKKPKKTAKKLIGTREVVDKKKMLVLAKNNMEIERALDNFKRAYRSLRDEVNSITSERDKKEAMINKYENKLDLYAQDFDNFKERAKKEKKKIEIQGNQRLIKKLLEIYDNIDRAMENTKPTDKAKVLLDGIDMIRKRFLSILSDEGVEPIESLGNKFDPRLHEALAMVESDEYGDDIICLELQKGFMFRKDEDDEEEEEEELDENGEKKQRKGPELVRVATVHVSKGSGGKKKKKKPVKEESEEEEKPTPKKMKTKKKMAEEDSAKEEKPTPKKKQKKKKKAEENDAEKKSEKKSSVSSSKAAPKKKKKLKKKKS